MYLWLLTLRLTLLHVYCPVFQEVIPAILWTYSLWTFSESKTMAIFVNYTRKSFFKKLTTTLVSTQALPRAVTKISSCQVNTTSRLGRESNGWGFLLVLFFFYFPMKVAGGHVQSSQGKSLAPRSYWQPCIPSLLTCRWTFGHQKSSSVFRGYFKRP